MSTVDKNNYPFVNQPAGPAVYYFPSQGIPMGNTKVDATSGDEALARALQAAEQNVAVPVAQIPAQPREGCKWSFWRRGGYNRLDAENGNRCCYKDDGRPLGDLNSFMKGLAFGTIAPIFSLLCTHGFETSKLTRLGSLFGNANFFLALALFAARIVGFFAFVPLIISFILLFIAKRSFWWFMSVYAKRDESEKMKVVSEVGSCKHFALGLVASLLFCFLGAAIALIAGRRYLKARHGVFIGLGINFVISSLFFFHGFAVMIAGLSLIQITTVHFRRAISSAQGGVSHC